MLLINNPFGAYIYEKPSITSNFVGHEPFGFIEEDEIRSALFDGWFAVITPEGKHGYIRGANAERV